MKLIDPSAPGAELETHKREEKARRQSPAHYADRATLAIPVYIALLIATIAIGVSVEPSLSNMAHSSGLHRFAWSAMLIVPLILFVITSGAGFYFSFQAEKSRLVVLWGAAQLLTAIVAAFGVLVTWPK